MSSQSKDLGDSRSVYSLAEMDREREHQRLAVARDDSRRQVEPLIGESGRPSLISGDALQQLYLETAGHEGEILRLAKAEALAQDLDCISLVHIKRAVDKKRLSESNLNSRRSKREERKRVERRRKNKRFEIAGAALFSGALGQVLSGTYFTLGIPGQVFILLLLVTGALMLAYFLALVE